MGHTYCLKVILKNYVLDNFFLESSNVSMEIGTMVFKCSVVLIHKSLTLPI